MLAPITIFFVSICWAMYAAMRSSILANEPDISDARTMFTYSGPNNFGYLLIASENCLPDSTSVLMLSRIFLNLGLTIWSEMPSSAARMLMPARIITANCVVKSRMSFWLGPEE